MRTNRDDQRDGGEAKWALHGTLPFKWLFINKALKFPQPSVSAPQ